MTFVEFQTAGKAKHVGCQEAEIECCTRRGKNTTDRHVYDAKNKSYCE